MTIGMPKFLHTAMMISAGIAHTGSFSQSGPSIPTTARAALNSPSSWYIYRQTTAIAMMLVTTGAK